VYSIHLLSRMRGSTPSHAPAAPRKSLPPYIVKRSPIHGTGVFARRRIPAGTRIIEYRGERISWEKAQQRAEESGQAINHTYSFSLGDERVSDGGRRGNEARYINHACEPNCEAMEHEDGRVYIYAMREIERGEELHYNYALIYEGRHTPAVKRAFACHCGTPGCEGTYLAPKTRR